MIERLSLIRAELLAKLSQANAGCLSEFSPERYIALLDAQAGNIREPARYNRPPEEVVSISKQLLERAGSEYLDTFHKLILTDLMAGYEERVTRRSVPDSVRGLIQKCFTRIIREFDTNPPQFYQFGSDLFHRDLSLARLILLPAGPGVVEVQYAPRSLLVRNQEDLGKRALQFARGMLLFGAKARGFGPFYSTHTDPRTIKEFTPEGWIFFYERVAELLEMNPHIRGVFRSSWFIDPKLAEISPRLLYLRVMPQENGAEVFYWGSSSDDEDNATAKSATRRRLVKEGNYVPTCYYLVWLRRDILEWAKERREVFG
jgi:hypothetical protein